MVKLIWLRKAERPKRIGRSDYSTLNVPQQNAADEPPGDQDSALEDEPAFDLDDLKEIISSVGVEVAEDGFEVILCSLEGAARDYRRSERVRLSMPSETRFRKELEKIQTNSNRLSKALSELHPGTIKLIETAATGSMTNFIMTRPIVGPMVAELSLLAGMAKYVDGYFDHNPPGPRQEAKDNLVGSLAEIYGRYFGSLGFSRPPMGGQPCGPLIRFLTACFTKMGLNDTPEALASRFNKLRDQIELELRQEADPA